MKSDLFLTLALISSIGLQGCGGQSPSAGQDEDEGRRGNNLESPFERLSGKWLPLSKACNGVAVDAALGEAYLFQDNFFAAVRRSVNTPTRICNEAFIFERLIHSSSTSSELYLERSSLRATALKTVCRRVVDGVVSPTPDSEKVEEFTSPAESAVLRVEAKTFSLQISEFEGCPGLTTLELSKTTSSGP